LTQDFLRYQEVVHKGVQYTPANKNPYRVIIADLTHRCNMTCANCYIPNRQLPDMDADKFMECIKAFPNRTEIRLMGAEATMRKDLPDIIHRIKTETRHRAILLTNGLRLARKQYVKELKDAGLKYVYVSVNGADNDDWYEQIDEMRCAKKKIQALENLLEYNLTVDTGTIIQNPINLEAPGRLYNLLQKIGYTRGAMRFKNVGQIGRYSIEQEENLPMRELHNTVCNQLGVDPEWAWTQDLVDGLREKNSRFFSVDGSSNRGRGFWAKITNWNVETNNPDPNSRRRGRITENFMVAPFFEHVYANEGGY